MRVSAQLSPGGAASLIIKKIIQDPDPKLPLKSDPDKSDQIIPDPQHWLWTASINLSQLSQPFRKHEI